MSELWPYQPETGMVETLEWMTEVLVSRTGEQRIQLRAVPRRSLQLSHIFEAKDAAWARLWARRNGLLDVLIPDWPDAIEIDEELAASTTVINIDTTIMDLRVDGQLIVWENEYSSVVATIDSMTDSSVTLSAPLGTLMSRPTIAPIRTAYMVNGAKFKRATTITTATFEFQIRDNVDLTPVDPIYQTYLDVEVLTDRPVLIDDISSSVMRAVEYVDNGFGLVVLEDVKNYADFGQTLGFYETRGAPLWRRRQWLHSLRGKQGTFWMPVFSSELIPTDDLLSADTVIKVESVSPVTYYAGKVIVLQLTDGTFLVRGITEASVFDSVSDSLTLSSALGIDIPPEELVMICFANLSRLNTDSIEMRHDMNNVAITVAIVEIPE